VVPHAFPTPNELSDSAPFPEANVSIPDGQLVGSDDKEEDKLVVEHESVPVALDQLDNVSETLSKAAENKSPSLLNISHSRQLP
jgi:hypothetical protein